MQEGEHQHTTGDPYGLHSHRKTFAFALFGLLFAIIAYSLAANPDIAFEIVVNNTNLAPTFAGGPTGTGERVTGNLYYTNTSAIQILVFSHANSPSQTAHIMLSINGTVVSHTGLRPLGTAEQTNTTIIAVIPKNSNYSVTFENFHHYEWREYPILSGKNGTISINQTIVQGGGGGVSFNGSAVDLNGSSFYNGSQQSGTFNHTNLTRLLWSQSGHTIDTNLNMSNFNITHLFDLNMTGTINGNSLNLTDGGSLGGDFSLNRHAFNNVSFIRMQATGTAGFDVQNVATTVVNSLAVGSLGNMNMYGNWNSTVNNVSDTTHNVWAVRFGVAGTQTDRLRFIYLPTNDTNYGHDIAGDEDQTKMEINSNKSVNFTTQTIILNGIIQSDPSASANMFVCWDSGTNKTFLKSTAC